MVSSAGAAASSLAAVVAAESLVKSIPKNAAEKV